MLLPFGLREHHFQLFSLTHQSEVARPWLELNQ